MTNVEVFFFAFQCFFLPTWWLYVYHYFHLRYIPRPPHLHDDFFRRRLRTGFLCLEFNYVQ